MKPKRTKKMEINQLLMFFRSTGDLMSRQTLIRRYLTKVICDPKKLQQKKKRSCSNSK